MGLVARKQQPNRGRETPVRTFRARSLNEALSTVKRELGTEAVILSTRKLRRAWPGGGPGGIEVRAALPPRPASAATRRAQPDSAASEPAGTASRGFDARQLVSLQQAIANMYQQVRRSRLEKVAEQDLLDRYLQGFRQEVEQATSTLRSLVAETRLLRDTGLPAAQAEVIRQLIDGGVEPGHAEAIVRSSPQDADDVETVRLAVTRFLLRQLPFAPPLQTARGRRVAAFVGPTGVGKTTTVAKLAAAALITGRRVGLVSCDTYRLGGAEQLKAYADCLRIPCERAESPGQVRQALERLGDRNLVLIDTAGVNPRQGNRLQAIAALVSRAWVDELHLVLSAQAGIPDLHNWRRQNGVLSAQRLVVSKLDEAANYGMLCNGPLMLRTPLSYLCTGQRVPEDLEVATPERVVRLLLSGSRRAAGGAA